MESVTWQCDCGCNKVANSNYEKRGWLVIDQPFLDDDSLSPKLERFFHFASFQCLQTWITKVNLAIEKFKEDSHLYGTPRGSITFDNLPDIYI